MSAGMIGVLTGEEREYRKQAILECIENGGTVLFRCRHLVKVVNKWDGAEGDLIAHSGNGDSSQVCWDTPVYNVSCLNGEEAKAMLEMYPKYVD